jgi:hypothetical protein
MKRSNKNTAKKQQSHLFMPYMDKKTDLLLYLQQNAHKSLQLLKWSGRGTLFSA